MLKQMVTFVGVTVLMLGVSATPSPLHASNIVYQIKDHADYEAGWTLSGEITTDGNLGVLTAADILSWSVTLKNGSTTISFNDNGQNVGAFGGFSSFYGLTATSTKLYAQTPPTNGGVTGIVLGSPLIPGATSGAQGPTVGWAYYDFTPNSSFTGVNPQIGYYWRVTGSNLNGFDWTIATVNPATHVPEPSGLCLAGIGALVFSAYAFRRRR